MRKAAPFVVLLVLGVLAVPVQVGAAGAPVDVDLTPDQLGVWVTYADGTVEARGTGTPHYGDRPPLAGGEQVVALAPTAGAGYWLFTDRGNVFAYGDANDHGDVGHITLASPVIAAVSTSTGDGYYLLGQDGGIFAFGDAEYHGSLPGLGVVPNLPVVSMATTAGGYLLIAEDGGTFAFGTAGYHGSLPGLGLSPAAPVIDLVPGSAGYLMLGDDGGIFNFGTSQFHGSLVGFTSATAVGAAIRDDLSGYLVLTDDGTVWAFGNTRSAGVSRITGVGSALVDLAVPAASVVRTVHEGASGDFTVWALDATNVRQVRLVDETGPSDGFHWLNDADTVKFEVTASGSWTIEVAPTSYATKWRHQAGPLDGRGSDVVLILPVGASTFSADTSGGGSNVVWHDRGAYLYARDVLLSVVGAVTGAQDTIRATGNVSRLEVTMNSDVDWQFHIG